MLVARVSPVTLRNVVVNERVLLKPTLKPLSVI